MASSVALNVALAVEWDICCLQELRMQLDEAKREKVEVEAKLAELTSVTEQFEGLALLISANNTKVVSVQQTVYSIRGAVENWVGQGIFEERGGINQEIKIKLLGLY